MTERGPSLAADAVIPWDDDQVILIERGRPPFRGQWALPGGFVETGETVESACVREVAEETGLEVEVDRLLGVYSDPERDPRGHIVSTVFVVRHVGGDLAAGDDAATARAFPISDPPPLAFDHDRILADARSSLPDPG